MKTTLLASARDASAQFVRLAKRATEIWIATAWASDHTDVSTALWNARSKVSILVVGLDFYQTDPAFLRRFQAYARVCKSVDGTFHPKLYLFRDGSHFSCIIGSSNLTRGGFASNVESNVVLSGMTSDSLFDELVALARDLDSRGRLLTNAELDRYDAAHKQKQKTLRRATSPLATVVRRGPDLDVSWTTFVRELERRGRQLFPDTSHRGYVGVIEDVQHLFDNRGGLSAMTWEQRQQVAGLVGDYRWFGSMLGAGHFRRHVRLAPARLDRALAHIPRHSTVVTKRQFDAFVRSLPVPGMGRPAVGSRLLAMWRPDLFFCIDSRNREALSEAFGFSSNYLNSYDGYWELLTVLWHRPWFLARPPRGKAHLSIWKARVALVDAFFYRP